MPGSSSPLCPSYQPCHRATVDLPADGIAVPLWKHSYNHLQNRDAPGLRVTVSSGPPSQPPRDDLLGGKWGDLLTALYSCACPGTTPHKCRHVSHFFSPKMYLFMARAGTCLPFQTFAHALCPSSTFYKAAPLRNWIPITPESIAITSVKEPSGLQLSHICAVTCWALVPPVILSVCLGDAVLYVISAAHQRARALTQPCSSKEMNSEPLCWACSKTRCSLDPLLWSFNCVFIQQTPTHAYFVPTLCRELGTHFWFSENPQIGEEGKI